MEPIQINVTIKFDDATQAFLSSLFRGVAKPATAPDSAERPKPAPAPVKPAEQPKPTAPVEQPKPTAPVEQPKSAAPAKPVEQPKLAATSAQSSITIDGLRELAMTKMNAHRVEIKQKLTELGTPSITKLDASKYQEMHEFLKNLS